MWTALILSGQIILALLYIQFLRHQVKARREFLRAQKWVYLAIRAPRANVQSTLAVEQIFTQLHVIAASLNWRDKLQGKVALWYSFEIVAGAGQIKFLIRTARQYYELLTAALYAQYPEIEVTQVSDYLADVTCNESSSLDLWGAEITLTQPSALPIRTYRDFEHNLAAEKIIDPLKPLLEALATIHDREVYVIQILARPLPNSQWKPGVERYAATLASSSSQAQEGQRAFINLPDVEKERINSVLRKAGHPGFAVKIRHLYLASKRNFDSGRKTAVLSAYQTFGNPYSNQFQPESKVTGIPARPFFSAWLEQPLTSFRTTRRKRALLQRCKERSMDDGLPPIVLNTTELATLYHLPIIQEDEAPPVSLSSISVRSGQPPANLPVDTGQGSGVTIFARTVFRDQHQAFGIKLLDLRRHTYLIGKTGMGKTTMMEAMAVQDIRQGRGVAFIDPHGDSVAKLLDYIPANRIRDVIYFNPADLDHPPAVNALESVDRKFQHLAADGLMSVFTKIWANMWSARMEYILSNTIRALLDSPGNTLLGVPRMYTDSGYRRRIVSHIRDPIVRRFWTDEFANWDHKYLTEAVAPIQNKVGQFLSSRVIRNIVGQTKSTIDLRRIMDERKVLLVDLSKGKLGEDNAALLGGLLVTKLQLAALSRADIAEENRQDFYLYADEFQNVTNEAFATILSEARKYHLNLIIGHQYIGQLERKIRDAIFGNAGTMVCFRLGASDADFLATEFAPTFTANDLVSLPKYHIVLRLMIDGLASDPFTAVTVPPSGDLRTGNAERVIRVSRERYSRPVAVVENKIGRWLGAKHKRMPERSKVLSRTSAQGTPN
jgi:hypothetical protein